MSINCEAALNSFHSWAFPSIRRFALHRKHFDRSLRTLSFVIAGIATAGVLLQSWFEVPDSGILRSFATLAGVDEENTTILPVFISITAVSVFIVTLGLTRLSLFYGAKLFSAQISTLLTLRLHRFGARPTGLSILRGVLLALLA